MITIFPKRTFLFLSLIIFLPGPARYQLNRVRYHIPITIIRHQNMDVIRGEYIIQHAEPVTLLCLKRPLQPSPTVSGELQKEFLFMAPMGYVLYVTGQIMSVCSRHLDDVALNQHFCHQKCPFLSPKIDSFSQQSYSISISSLGPTPEVLR